MTSHDYIIYDIASCPTRCTPTFEPVVPVVIATVNISGKLPLIVLYNGNFTLKCNKCQK